MSRSYTEYYKNQIDWVIYNVSRKNNLGYVPEVSEKMEQETGVPYWEYVYELSTNKGYLTILIYTSVDKRTNKTRNNGKDAVRIIYKMRARGSVFYRLVKKHQRIDTLLQNLELTLSNASVNTDRLGNRGWYENISNVN